MKYEDRDIACDFCGEKKPTAITQYGTSHYNRVICKECTDKINAEHKAIDGVENIVEKSTKNYTEDK